MSLARIFLVEDEAIIAEDLNQSLQRMGYEIPFISASGAEALKKLETVKPDLVLMDVVMPNLNGFQATRALTRDESTKHIPIILVTTKDQDTDRVWGMRQGAKAYLTKPFSEEELGAVIKQVMGNPAG